MALNTYGQDTTLAGGSVVPTAPTTPVPSTITTADLKAPTSSLNIPPAPADHTPQYAATLGSVDSIFQNAYAPTPTDTAQAGVSTSLSSLYKTLAGDGASVDGSGQIDTSGALPNAQDQAAKSLGYNSYADLANQLNGINGQIQGLQKEALGYQTYDANKDPALAGQGVTKAGAQPLNLQNAELLRQNTIKALGLSAISQTLQGNVARAQDIASKAVEAEFRPYQTQLSYLQNIYNLNKDTLQREDSKRAALVQAQLAARQTALDQAKQDKSTALALSAAAMKNNPGNQSAQTAAQQVLNLDPQAPDYLQKVYQLVGQYQSDPLATQKTLSDIAQNRAQTAYYNAQSAKLYNDIKAAGGSSSVAQQRSTAVNIVNTVLSDPQLGATTAYGPGILNRLVPGGAVQNTLNNLKQLKGILALENRSQLKGSGAISDFESRTLDHAASSLGINEDGTTNLSTDDLKKQLVQVRGALTTISGQPAYVKVIDNNGNSQITQATSDQISKMVTDGLQVEYQ